MTFSRADRHPHADLAPHPRVVVLDVNETLTDMRPLAQRLRDVGAPAQLLATWFAGTLRDGIALTLAGGYADFAEVAAAVLRSLLAGTGSVGDLDHAVDHVISAMAHLPLHPDVAPGVKRLRERGYRVVALTNGSSDTAGAVLRRGGVAEELEACLSVAEVKRWKPAPEPYHHAAQRCGVAPAEMMLVAVHPWDIDGAQRAGLSAAWIDRSGTPYPEPLLAPALRADDLRELADSLSALK
jgi:2-haloacid dehalogenase